MPSISLEYFHTLYTFIGTQNFHIFQGIPTRLFLKVYTCHPPKNEPEYKVKIIGTGFKQNSYCGFEFFFGGEGGVVEPVF
jgi:hypothetical protein